MALTLPERIDRFRVVRTLGAGAMGVVYEAIDEELGRRVAVKLVDPTESSRRRQRRLLREAQAMARLAHPNVVVIYEVGTVDDEVYIAMELVEGPNLAAWLAATERNWDAVVRVFLQAGRGMRAAHEVGLIHRDFKPANVLIGADGRVRVADFGVARPADEREFETSLPAELLASMTESGALVGTPAYMAPELLEGGQADALSDQFSFCVALYQALYGVRPFVGADVEQLLADIESRELAVAPRGRKVPAWVHAVVVRGLGPRAQRWRSMDALLRALDLDARRRRRRAGVLASVLVLLTGAAGFAWVRLAAQRCETSDALAGVWDAEVRVELRNALLDVPNAEQTAAAVINRLDAYAQAWLATRAETCEATRIHGEQSEALMDARMRCLDRRALELGALVRVLRDADVDVAERAVSAVADLPAIERCSDPDYVNAELPPPDDPATAAKVEAIRESLALVRALERSGRLIEARGQIEDLLEETTALDYRPLIAELGLTHGALLDELGDGKAAAVMLEQAYFDAEACGDDEIAQSAALRLVHVLGYRLARAQAAEMWARLAEAKIDYTGDELGRVHLAISRGEVHDAAKEPEAALAAYLEAQRLHEVVAHPDPLLDAEILDDIGLIQLELGRYDEARATLERAYVLWTSELGDNHPLVARGLSSLGILHVRTGHYREATLAWEAAREIWVVSKGAENDDVAAMHSNLGVAYRMIGDHEAALRNLERALAIRERLLGPDDPGIASVLGNLGNLALHREDYAAARAAYARGLEIREAEFGPNDVRLATMLDGVGEAELGLGDPRRALVLLERALALREHHLAPGHHHITEIRMKIATAQLELGEFESARVQLELGLAEIAGRPAQEAGICRTGLVHARVLEVAGNDQAAHTQAAAALDDCHAHDPENVRAITKLEQWLERQE